MTADVSRIAPSDIAGDEVERKHVYPRVLVIAGSEPLGSAGVQADIKSVSACGAYAAGSITCIVNEDTTAVKEIVALPADFVVGQARSFLEDVGADSIKVGMLFTRELVLKVAGLLEDYPHIPAVVDPVMVNSTGQRLIEQDAVEAYRTVLFPKAVLITPNSREAELLLGRQVTEKNAAADMEEIVSWGSSAVVKSVRPGGERQLDFLRIQGSDSVRIFEKRLVRTPNVNGTGCSFSSSIAAFLAKGHALGEAVAMAEEYIDGAIRSGAGYRFGRGFGPVDHFWFRRRKDYF